MRLIDADAIQIPKTHADAFENCRNCELLDADQVREIIDSAPTIEPKQGKWIDAEIRHEDGVLPIQVCSECKTFYPLEYTGGGHRFCPNCGADMRERKEK